MGGFFKITNMKYQVIAGCFAGIKKVHKYGEVLTANMIDNPTLRVKEGWLKVVQEDEVTVEEPIAEVEPPVVVAEVAPSRDVTEMVAQKPDSPLSHKLKSSRN